MNRDLGLNILEAIPVIQGEGQSTGVPMILIRLGGCNLNCMFKGSICDAEESSWDHDMITSKRMSLNEVEEVILANPHIKHVMITGGQPTFHPSIFKLVLNECIAHGLLVEIEDNGTTYINDLDPKLLNLVSLSPKLENSIPVVGKYIEILGRETTAEDRAKHIGKYRNIPSLQKWITNFNYQLKFVISDEDEINEALKLCSEIGADLERVYFMPEGCTRKQLDSRRKWLYERCIELGIRYTDRLHIIVYDNLKGV